MNKWICIPICIFFLWSFDSRICAQSSAKQDSAYVAQIAFEKSSFSFGDVNQGDKVEHLFTFKNAGLAPLVLENVLTTCGCTVPEWPREPIPPGGNGRIKVAFDSTSKIGRQNKVITVRSNSKSGDFRLRITAMVLPISK